MGSGKLSPELSERTYLSDVQLGERKVSAWRDGSSPLRDADPQLRGEGRKPTLQRIAVARKQPSRSKKTDVEPRATSFRGSTLSRRSGRQSGATRERRIDKLAVFVDEFLRRPSQAASSVS